MMTKVSSTYLFSWISVHWHRIPTFQAFAGRLRRCYFIVYFIPPATPISCYSSCTVTPPPSSWMLNHAQLNVSLVFCYSTDLESSPSINAIPPPCPLYTQFSNVTWLPARVPDRKCVKNKTFSRRSQVLLVFITLDAHLFYYSLENCFQWISIQSITLFCFTNGALGMLV